MFLFVLNSFICRNYNGPQKASPEHKGSSQRNYSRGPYSPGFEFEDDSHSKYLSDHSRSKIMYERDMEDSEVKLISFLSLHLPKLFMCETDTVCLFKLVIYFFKLYTFS